MDGYRKAFGASPDDIQGRQIAIHQLLQAARRITDAELDHLTLTDPDLADKIALMRRLAEQI